MTPPPASPRWCSRGGRSLSDLRDNLVDRARRTTVTQRFVSIGFFERMYVPALKVLDDLHFAGAAIVERPDLGRDAGEASKSCCTQAPCSNDQLEVLAQGVLPAKNVKQVARPNRTRLQGGEHAIGTPESHVDSD